MIAKAPGGGPKGRILGFLGLMTVGICFPVLFLMRGFGTAAAKEEEPLVETTHRYTGPGLEAEAPRFDRLPEKLPETTPPPAEPLPTPTPTRPPEVVKEPGLDLELIRKRSSGPLAVVAATKVERLSEAAAAPSRRMRHIPRGTVMTAFLESRVRSDNLDSRARARLLEDYELGGDVVLPAGGYFIGNAASLDSRYQNRVAVRVTNYIYPDREREVAVNGLLLNPDESAHLLADDVDHHSGKLVAGIVGLELLRAASGALGGYQGGSRVAVSFGGDVGSTAGDVFEPSLQKLTEVLPTITVEPGKPVLVFVEDSFDVPELSDLPKGYAAPAVRQDAPASGKDAQLEESLERLTEAMKSAERMQSMAPQGMPGGAIPGGLR